jgi:hypothetical protein
MVLATSSIGAIWSSTSPELGESAILERFMQVCWAYRYKFLYVSLMPRAILAVSHALENISLNRPSFYPPTSSDSKVKTYPSSPNSL